MSERYHPPVGVECGCNPATGELCKYAQWNAMTAEESPWKDQDSPALAAALKQFAAWFPPEKFGRKAMLERQEFNMRLGFKKKKRRG